MSAGVILAAVLAGAVAALSLPLWAEIAVALRAWGRRLPGAAEPEIAPKLLFLVPAHNEEPLITQCVDSLVRQHYPHDALRVVVIADNCDDWTAAFARLHGAECLERVEPELRGKPHAIRWAIERIEPDWDALVIIDADSEVDADFARALAQRPSLAKRVAQAHFGIRNPRESWLTRLADLLNWSTYRFRYAAKRRAGLNCPMTGNGMCIGRDVLRAHPWRTTSLTENWELYAEYTAAGVPIDYVPGARLLSQEVRTLEQGETQRRRWTAGRYGVLRRHGRSVLRSREIGWAQKLDCIAELAAPSPVVHLALALGILTLSLFTPPGVRLPLAAAGLATLLPQGLAAARAFAIYPDRPAVLGALLHLPIYMYWRCVVLLRTALGPRQGWARSDRHEEGDEAPSLPFAEPSPDLDGSR